MARFVYFFILIFLGLLERWSLVEGLSCWKCIAKHDASSPEPDFLYTCEGDTAGFNDDCGIQAVCVAREDWDESSGKLVQRQMYCVGADGPGGLGILPTGCVTHRLQEGNKVTLIKSCLCNHEDDCNKIGFAELEKILPTGGQGDDIYTKLVDDDNTNNSSQSLPGGRSIAAAAGKAAEPNEAGKVAEPNEAGKVAEPNKAGKVVELNKAGNVGKNGHTASSRRPTGPSKKKHKRMKRKNRNRRKHRFRDPYISTYDSNEH
ncbi:unnamed protein product [Orchesella dallaii]|uniref:Uncharacterized protein n=1 Tax=Orchesella dallaii TaxID=48710 RepID=A0ABP1Q7Q6_9HEXA